MNSFQFSSPATGTYQYNYYCANNALQNSAPLGNFSTPSAVCGASLLTSLAPYSSVTCGGGSASTSTGFLTYFRLMETSAATNCWYNYKCVYYSGNFKCRVLTTALYAQGTSTANLAFHNVQCAANEALQSFSVIVSGTSIQYQYTCCKNLPSAGGMYSTAPCVL